MTTTTYPYRSRSPAPRPGLGFTACLPRTDDWTDRFGQRHSLRQMDSDYVANVRGYLDAHAPIITALHLAQIIGHRSELEASEPGPQMEPDLRAVRLRHQLEEWPAEVAAPVRWPYELLIEALSDPTVSDEARALAKGDLIRAMDRSVAAATRHPREWVRQQPIYRALTNELRSRVPEYLSDDGGRCPNPDCNGRRISAVVVSDPDPDRDICSQSVRFGPPDAGDPDPLPATDDPFLLGRCVEPGCGQVRLLATYLDPQAVREELEAAAARDGEEPDASQLTQSDGLGKEDHVYFVV